MMIDEDDDYHQVLDLTIQMYEQSVCISERFQPSQELLEIEVDEIESDEKMMSSNQYQDEVAILSKSILSKIAF